MGWSPLLYVAAVGDPAGNAGQRGPVVSDVYPLFTRAVGGPFAEGTREESMEQPQRYRGGQGGAARHPRGLFLSVYFLFGQAKRKYTRCRCSEIPRGGTSCPHMV